MDSDHDLGALQLLMFELLASILQMTRHDPSRRALRTSPVTDDGRRHQASPVLVDVLGRRMRRRMRARTPREVTNRAQ